jgi:hypothetical protein
MPADSNGDATTRWVSQGLNPSYELLRRDRAGDDAGGRGEIRPPRRIDPAKLPGVTATLDFIAIVITIVVPRSAIAYLRMRATWPSPGIQNPCRGVLALTETQGLWFPGSRFACPGMTKKNFFLRERSQASDAKDQFDQRFAFCPKPAMLSTKAISAVRVSSFFTFSNAAIRRHDSSTCSPTSRAKSFSLAAIVSPTSIHMQPCSSLPVITSQAEARSPVVLRKHPHRILYRLTCRQPVAVDGTDGHPPLLWGYLWLVGRFA